MFFGSFAVLDCRNDLHSPAFFCLQRLFLCNHRSAGKSRHFERIFTRSLSFVEDNCRSIFVLALCAQVPDDFLHSSSDYSTEVPDQDYCLPK